MSLYSELLHPEFYYEKPAVARFIETLSEPEIESASYDQIRRLKQEMMATDDIDTLAEDLAMEARETVIHTGTIAPQFIGYLDKEHRVKFRPETKIPTTPKSVRRFLRAGKALGISRTAQCIFFVTMQPLKDNKPIFGDDVVEPCPWGILVIGSSLRGNCFVHLQKMVKKESLSFETAHHDILREGQYEYPYSKLFHIEDYDEMADIIEQASKLTDGTTIPERKCLINFATTLKALDFFGYSVPH